MDNQDTDCNMCVPLRDGAFHLTPCYRSEKAVVLEDLPRTFKMPGDEERKRG